MGFRSTVIAAACVLLLAVSVSACTNNLNEDFNSKAQLRWSEAVDELDFRRISLQDRLAAAAAFPGGFSGRGIAMGVQSAEVASAIAALTLLRDSGNELPVEVFYAEKAATSEEQSLAAKQDFVDVKAQFALVEGVTVVPLTAASPAELQVRAVIESSFAEVLYLGANTMSVKNPASLFDSAEYAKTGALFFPGVHKTSAANPIWVMLGRACLDSHEQSAHALLINKEKAWTGLQSALVLATTHYVAQRFLDGSHDVFRLGFLSSGANYHMVEHKAHPVGSNLRIAAKTRFCAHSVALRDAAGEVALIANMNNQAAEPGAKLAAYNCLSQSGSPIDALAPGFHANLLSVQEDLKEKGVQPKFELLACTPFNQAAAEAWIKTKTDYKIDIHTYAINSAINRGPYTLRAGHVDAYASCNWNDCSTKGIDYYVRLFNVSTYGAVKDAKWAVTTPRCAAGATSNCMKYGNETIIQVWLPGAISSGKCQSTGLGIADGYIGVQQRPNTWAIVAVGFDVMGSGSGRVKDPTDQVFIKFTYQGSGAAFLTPSVLTVALLAFFALFAVRR